jgi:hypothetical protein
MEDIVREAPPSLPSMTDEAYAEFQNQQLLPDEENMFRNRSGAHTLEFNSESSDYNSDVICQL